MKRLWATAALTQTAVVGCLVMGIPLEARASLVGAYLFSGQTSPINASAPAFTVDATGVRQLTLNSGVATGFSVVPNFSFRVDRALTYRSHDRIIDSGEPGAGSAARVNKEVGTWDDVGIIVEGSTDAAKNVDFGNNASVRFKPIPGGFLDLIIAEDAGLDPFKLSICDGSDCTTVFNGFDIPTRKSLLALSDFAGNDSSKASEMDQGFLFRFNAPVTGSVKIKETKNFGGEMLEVDFVGVGTVVPIPAAAWLFGSALLGVAGIGYRRRATNV